MEDSIEQLPFWDDIFFFGKRGQERALIPVLEKKEAQEINRGITLWINKNALLFVNNRITIINAIWPIHLSWMSTLDIVDYKNLFTALDKDIKNQIETIDIVANNKKQTIKIALQEEMLVVLQSKLLIFYYDYLVRSCNERSYYPYLKAQIEAYDRLWWEKYPDQIIINNIQIKWQWLPNMQNYGYNKRFFAENNALYEQFLAKQ